VHAVAQTQAAQYVGDVVFDGSLADNQLFGNRAIRRAFLDNLSQTQGSFFTQTYSSLKDGSCLSPTD
jgi:hypothetical protein